MNICLIRSTDYDVIAEVVKTGLFSITVKNPIRVIDSQDKQNAINYTIYSPFVGDKVKLNKFVVSSITPVSDLTKQFYIKTVLFMEKHVMQEYDRGIRKYIQELDTAMDNFEKRSEYMKNTDSDVVVVGTTPGSKLH